MENEERNDETPKGEQLGVESKEAFPLLPFHVVPILLYVQVHGNTISRTRHLSSILFLSSLVPLHTCVKEGRGIFFVMCFFMYVYCTKRCPT